MLPITAARERALSKHARAPLALAGSLLARQGLSQLPRRIADDDERSESKWCVASARRPRSSQQTCWRFDPPGGVQPQGTPRPASPTWTLARDCAWLPHWALKQRARGRRPPVVTRLVCCGINTRMLSRALWFWTLLLHPSATTACEPHAVRWARVAAGASRAWYIKASHCCLTETSSGRLGRRCRLAGNFA